MKTQEEEMYTEDASETGLVSELELDQEAIARLAYFYWEERGCQNDSPNEDWFRAEAELRSRLACAATA